MKDWEGMAFPKSSKMVLKAKQKDISKNNRENIKKLLKANVGFADKLLEYTFTT